MLGMHILSSWLDKRHHNNDNPYCGLANGHSIIKYLWGWGWSQKGGSTRVLKACNPHIMFLKKTKCFGREVGKILSPLLKGWDFSCLDAIEPFGGVISTWNHGIIFYSMHYLSKIIFWRWNLKTFVLEPVINLKIFTYASALISLLKFRPEKKDKKLLKILIFSLMNMPK